MLRSTGRRLCQRQSRCSCLRRKSTASQALPPPPPRPEDFPSWTYEPRSFFRFEIIKQSAKSMARVGRIDTPHGIVDTPGFVPVATNAALKGVSFESQPENQLFFANTYHLGENGMISAHLCNMHCLSSRSRCPRKKARGYLLSQFYGTH